MDPLRVLPFYFRVLLMMAMNCVILGRRFDSFDRLERKSIEAFCPSNETVNLYLSGYGERSSMKLSVVHNYKSIDDLNCTIIIHTRNSGIILILDSTLNFGHLYGQCIEVSDDAGKNSTSLCGFNKPSYVSVGNIKFKYQIKNAIGPRSGFTILATAYKKDIENCDEFRCKTGECIFHGFVCDGVAHCPDGSDEIASENSCYDVRDFSLRPFDFNWHIVLPTSKSMLEYRKSFNVTITAAVGSAIFILLFGVLRFVWHYHCSTRRQLSPFHQTIRRISVIQPRPTYQSQFGSPPPPYTSLVNDVPNHNVSTTPPSYASISADVSDTNICINAADEASKQISSAEPPPPYEP